MNGYSNSNSEKVNNDENEIHGEQSKHENKKVAESKDQAPVHHTNKVETTPEKTKRTSSK